MKVEDAHELQAMLRYYAAAIIEAIDNGGLKPKQHNDLVKTCCRIAEIVEAIGRCPLDENN